MSEVRLVDANELIRQFKIDKVGVNFLDYNTKAAYADCIRTVKCAKTIDAEPVRHGHWIKITGVAPPEYHGLHYCSVCNEGALRDKHFREMLSDYCPACGARMDEEK